MMSSRNSSTSLGSADVVSSCRVASAHISMRSRSCAERSRIRLLEKARNMATTPAAAIRKASLP